MYAAHHAAVGTALTAGGYTLFGVPGLVVGTVAAIVSHHYVDILGESGYGKQTVFWEGVPLIVFVISAYFSGIWYAFVAGWLGSMLMDIVDKTRERLLGKPSIFPCHTTKGFVKVKLTLNQTKVLAVVSMFVYLALALI